MTFETCTMVTDLDDLDLECLKRRLETAADRLSKVKTKGSVQQDFRSCTATIESLKATDREGSLTVTAGSVGAMWELRLDMPTPGWWSPVAENMEEHVMEILETWDRLIRSSRARQTSTIDTAGTGLERLSVELGSILTSEGMAADAFPKIVVRARMPYEPAVRTPGHEPMVRLDPCSRTVGATRPRMISSVAEDALLSRHSAFRLEATHARSFSIEPAPAISTTPKATDAMDSLRILGALNLKAGSRHVLNAARSSKTTK